MKIGICMIKYSISHSHSTILLIFLLSFTHYTRAFPDATICYALLLLLSHILIFFVCCFFYFKFSLLFSASTLTVQVPRIICNIQLLIVTNNAFHCGSGICFYLTVVRHFNKLGSDGIHKNW